jgi:hypothetical protein
MIILIKIMFSVISILPIITLPIITLPIITLLMIILIKIMFSVISILPIIILPIMNVIVSKQKYVQLKLNITKLYLFMKIQI